MSVNDDPFSPAVHCASCGALLQGLYCSQCGEKRLPPGGYSLKDVLKEWFSATGHGEGKFLRTLKFLIFKPGFLTREYFAGRRTPYTRPAALFIAVNVLYFMFSGWNTFSTPLNIQLIQGPQKYAARALVMRKVLGPDVAVNQRNTVLGDYLKRQKVLDAILASPDRTQREIALKVYDDSIRKSAFPGPLERLNAYGLRFQVRERVLSKTLLVILIPILSAFMWLSLVAFKQNFVKQLIFATHIWSALLLILMCITWSFLGIAMLQYLISSSTSLSILYSDSVLSWILPVMLMIYMYVAIHRFYAYPRWLCGALSVWFFIGALISVILYRSVLFFVTFYSLSI